MSEESWITKIFFIVYVSALKPDTILVSAITILALFNSSSIYEYSQPNVLFTFSNVLISYVFVDLKFLSLFSVSIMIQKKIFPILFVKKKNYFATFGCKYVFSTY